MLQDIFLKCSPNIFDCQKKVCSPTVYLFTKKVRVTSHKSELCSHLLEKHTLKVTCMVRLGLMHGQSKQATCHHCPLWTSDDCQRDQQFSTPLSPFGVWYYWIVSSSLALLHQFSAHLELSERVRNVKRKYLFFCGLGSLCGGPIVSYFKNNKPGNCRYTRLLFQISSVRSSFWYQLTF